MLHADKILLRQAAVGRYDGKNPSLTCATTGGKLFIHSPHQVNANDEHITYLNINKQTTAVVAGVNPRLACLSAQRHVDMTFCHCLHGKRLN